MEGFATAGYLPWTITYYDREVEEDFGCVNTKFLRLSQVLNWINEIGDDHDPEWESGIVITYQAHEDWEPDPDNQMALVGNRVVLKVVDGWAGGQASYRLQMPSQFGVTSGSQLPNEFWMSEGPGLIIFYAEDL